MNHHGDEDLGVPFKRYDIMNLDHPFASQIRATPYTEHMVDTIKNKKAPIYNDTNSK